MMKEIDVCYIKLFLRIDFEKFNRSLLRDGNFQFIEDITSKCTEVKYNGNEKNKSQLLSL